MFAKGDFQKCYPQHFCLHQTDDKQFLAIRNSYKINFPFYQTIFRCDHFGGFMTLLSLAGGTGSGLGAYVNTSLRDEYPHSFIMNQVYYAESSVFESN